MMRHTWWGLIQVDPRSLPSPPSRFRLIEVHHKGETW